MEKLAVELPSNHRRIETIQAELTDVSAAGQIAKQLTQLQIRIDQQRRCWVEWPIS
jgi:hypothetical protein